MSAESRRSVMRVLKLAQHPDRLYNKATSKLPPALAGRVDFFARPSLRSSLDGPMNGQEARRRIVAQIFEKVPIEAIVETGTFRGSSAEYFADRFGVPVRTVESHPRYFTYSRLRFKNNRSVHVSYGDSRAFLRSLAGEVSFPSRGVFFYLDAHWGRDLPLQDELSLIFEEWSDAVILIDDFQVHDDPGYGFDDYGPGRRLCVDYLPDRAWSEYVALYPAVPSGEETGKKRGCIVLVANGLQHLVPELTELRQVPARSAIT
jgi:hypothetical protein